MFDNAKASNKRIKAQIKAISNRNQTLRSMIQSTLCEISAHSYEHGDVTMFTHLLDSVKGQDRKAIIDWIEKYGFAKIKSDGAFSLNKTMRDNAEFANGQAVYDEYTHEDTEVVPWFDFVKSVKQIAKDLTLDQMVIALVKKGNENIDENADLKGRPRATVVKESTTGGLENAIAQLQKLANSTKVVPLKAVA